MYKTILIAVDVNDTTGSTRNIEEAMTLARDTDAELHLVNVLPDTGIAIVSTILGPEKIKKMVEDGKAALKEFATSALAGKAKAKLHLAQGTVYHEIIKCADHIGADLIVVGAHRPEFQDYLVGPNAARVVRHANQSVFVVR